MPLVCRNVISVSESTEVLLNENMVHEAASPASKYNSNIIIHIIHKKQNWTTATEYKMPG
jgi:hypothetical protein